MANERAADPVAEMVSALKTYGLSHHHSCQSMEIGCDENVCTCGLTELLHRLGASGMDGFRCDICKQAGIPAEHVTVICHKPDCEKHIAQPAAHVTKGLEARFECAARKAGTAGGNYPQDCDWPFCGCDEKASRVVEAVIECGWKSAKEAREANELLQEARAQRDWLKEKCGEIGVLVNVHIGAPLRQAYGLVNERAEAAEARNLELAGELEREREEHARLKRTIEFMEKEYLAGHGGSWGICKYQAQADELGAGWNELLCCDDIRLDQGLVVAISDLQKAREDAEKRLAEAEKALRELREKS